MTLWGNFLADIGQDDYKELNIRGATAIYADNSTAQEPMYFIVWWSEETPCGPKNYFLETEGLPESEVVAVAKSVVPAD